MCRAIKGISFAVIALFISISSLYAQTTPFTFRLAPPAPIDTIIIRGNRVTKDFVILEEIKAKVGTFVDSSILEDDRLRLESIGLFSHAETYLEVIDYETIAMVVEVTELWYIWPGIFFALDEDRPERFALGALISHDNFRGRREQLSLDFRYGFMTGSQILWNIPYISQKYPDLSLKLRARYIEEEEPRYIKKRGNIKAIDYTTGIKLGYRIDLQHRVYVNFKITAKEFKTKDGAELTPEINLPTGSHRRDILGEYEFTFSRDTRKYKPWANSGIVYQLTVGGGFGLKSFSPWNFVAVDNLLIGIISANPRTHLQGLFEHNIILGKSPVYRRILLDRQNNVRTSYSGVYEGKWLLKGSIEGRYDLLPIRYVTLKTLPFLHAYSKNLRFGLSTYAFSDVGKLGGVATYFDSTDEEIVSDGWDAGYGLGLAMHIPYRDLLRIEVIRSMRFPKDGFFYRVTIGAKTK